MLTTCGNAVEMARERIIVSVSAEKIYSFLNWHILMFEQVANKLKFYSDKLPTK